MGIKQIINEVTYESLIEYLRDTDQEIVVEDGKITDVKRKE